MQRKPRKLEDHVSPEISPMERGWYYRIEVEPNVWTPASGIPNVHLTRKALRRVDVRGLRCLDIGTMEALVPILLRRRGAGEVIAYDRTSYATKIEFLQKKLNVSFDLIHGVPLSDLDAKLREQGGEAATMFDLVVFSGVLYHMLDIVGGLLHARRQLRNGGIMIVETAAVFSDDQAAHLNAEGRFLSGDNYWLVSLGCLDTLLRFARLKPLDALYLRRADVGGVSRGRICVPCLAVDAPPRDPEDKWLAAEQTKDFREYIDWSVPRRYAREPLAYDTKGRSPVLHAFGSADIYKTFANTKETRVTDPKRQVYLRLDALY